MSKRVINIDWEMTPPQEEAWDYMTDSETREVLFGGGAGGGKTVLGIGWILIMSFSYPGTRWLVGRAVLKRLKETTLRTFFDLAEDWGFVSGKDYKFNSVDCIIRLNNGSEIMLKELGDTPSDPMFSRLGGLEITGAFIDEADEISVKAKNIVQSRIRYRLDEYDLVPKILYTCNPNKNWVYGEFYKPARDGELESNRKFIKALAKDNPFLPQEYIENLRRLDTNTRERLLEGNWEYDDDPKRLFDFEDIQDIFSNKAERSDEKFLSGDIARFGKDKTVKGSWVGYKVVINDRSHTSIPDNARFFKFSLDHEGIKASNAILDEDGVGGGVVDVLREESYNVKGFMGGSSPIQPKAVDKAKSPEEKDRYKKNYLNLRSQCYFLLAEIVREGKLQVVCSAEVRDKIIEELELIKETTAGKDNSKIAVISKDEIKKILGRSPDYADTLMMRMYFDLKKPKAKRFRVETF